MIRDVLTKQPNDGLCAWTVCTWNSTIIMERSTKISLAAGNFFSEETEEEPITYLFVFWVLGAYDVDASLSYDNATAVTHNFDRRPDFHPPRQDDWTGRLHTSRNRQMTHTLDVRQGCNPKSGQKWST